VLGGSFLVVIQCDQEGGRLKMSDALVPPKPKEFVIA
jgi:hypothetical protein